MMNLPYGELAIVQKSRSRGRTITETDVVNCCGLTGNWLEIHANTEFAKKSLYGQRVVQGGLVFVIANALFGFDSAVVEAFYGVDKLRFLKPTFIGDTLNWISTASINKFMINLRVRKQPNLFFR